MGVFSSLWARAVKMCVPSASSADISSSKEEFSWENVFYKSLEGIFVPGFPVFTALLSSLTAP